jgi:hypothetical protein
MGFALEQAEISRRFQMSRTLASIVIACLCSFPVLAQTLPTLPQEPKPQIAYNLFSTWADNYMTSARRGQTIAEGVLFTTGALSLAGSALTWYGGDEISRNASGSPMDADLKQNLTMGLGIGGGALVLSGMIVGSFPIKDYRSIYADIFKEKDPEVQEAMAVSVLRYQADKGKERRITSFITGLVVPVLSCCILGGVNVANGDSFGKDFMRNLGNSSWWMAGSIVSLFQKTSEERLYDRYLATRDALYGEHR